MMQGHTVLGLALSTGSQRPGAAESAEALPSAWFLLSASSTKKFPNYKS